jgi:hypothetical protein
VRRLLPLVAPAVAFSALLVGCGGGGGDAATGAAEIVPASAAVFVSVDTDFEGEQWQRAEELVRRFPGGRDALRSLLRELESEDVDFERDVKPAVGPEVGLVWLELADDAAVVLLTQPRDEAKFQELVEGGDDPAVTAEFDDWTAVAETQETLDRFGDERQGDSLADSDEFEEAMADLPEDAFATVYASGEALTSQIAANAQMTPEERAALDCFLPGDAAPALALAVSAEEDGVRLLAGAARSDEEAPERAGSELAEELPAGATSFVTMHGLGDVLRDRIRCIADANEEAARMLAQAELGLGVSLEEDVLPLFAGETVLASYPAGASGLTQDAGAGVPVAVVVTEVEDEARAREVADTIAARASAFAEGVDVQDVTIGAVDAKRVTMQDGTALFYAAFDGKLVLASTEGGIAALAGGAEAFADDERYGQAREAAGTPDETTGLVFLDLASLATEYSGLGVPLPPEVVQNLEPLRSFLLWGDVGEDRFALEAFLQID